MTEPNLNNFSIKSWAEDDRPREKLLAKGISALSDAELIAILIGSGTPKITAVDLAKEILKGVQNNLNELARLSVKDLMKHKGIGEAKAISIVTAMELGKRRRMADILERKKIESSSAIFELMYPEIGDLGHEEFHVIFLNNSSKIIGRDCFSKGGITGTIADVRLIMKAALEHKSTAIVLCHNHPSGNNRPSQSDIALTKKVKQAGEILDINVLDHVIIAHKEYYSFADEGVL
jgi:DNA repair protein RadC